MIYSGSFVAGDLKVRDPQNPAGGSRGLLFIDSPLLFAGNIICLASNDHPGYADGETCGSNEGRRNAAPGSPKEQYKNPQ